MARTRGKCHYHRSHHPPSYLNREMVNGALDRLVYVAPPAALDSFWRSHRRPRCGSPLLFAQSAMEIEMATKTAASNHVPEVTRVTLY